MPFPTWHVPCGSSSHAQKELPLRQQSCCEDSMLLQQTCDWYSMGCMIMHSGRVVGRTTAWQAVLLGTVKCEPLVCAELTYIFRHLLSCVPLVCARPAALSACFAGAWACYTKLQGLGFTVPCRCCTAAAADTNRSLYDSARPEPGPEKIKTWLHSVLFVELKACEPVSMLQLPACCDGPGLSMAARACKLVGPVRH